MFESEYPYSHLKKKSSFHPFVLKAGTHLNLHFLCRIMVLSEGQVLEYDSPDRLLNNTSSFFYKLATQAETS